MDKALHLAEHSSSAGESAGPKDVSTSLADEWSSASGESDQVIQSKTPVPISADAQTHLDNAASEHNELANKNPSVPASESAKLADKWSSATEDEATERGIADEWSSASDDGSNPLNRLVDEWSSASDSERDLTEEQSSANDISRSSVPTVNELADENPNVPESESADLADEWSSASEDEATERGIADEWSSASDEEDSNPLNRLVDEWSLASDSERDLQSSASDISRSSVPTVNSQMAISPSRITLDRPLDAFPLSQDWPAINTNDQLSHSPHNRTSEIHGPGHVQQYGPKHFNFLWDHLFTDDVSESEEEDS